MKPDTKQPLTPEQATWFENAANRPEFINPMVRKFGLDPEGRKCKGCNFLTANQCTKRFYKCRLRGITSGPGTDHRINWPACSKFTPFVLGSKPSVSAAFLPKTQTQAAPAS